MAKVEVRERAKSILIVLAGGIGCCSEQNVICGSISMLAVPAKAAFTSLVG
jgi:hypothetical protein